jgi:ubiquinone/menaquinone biosynthesis C-methylase UbiE
MLWPRRINPKGAAKRKKTKMNQSEIVREQFNRQAQKFNDWAVTKNIEYLKGISEFIEPTGEDTLLDVACGTGDFTLYTSVILKEAVGIDVSDKMIEIAFSKKNEMKIDNVDFRIGEVSQLPFPADFFDIVFSKSAFHHFDNAPEVFKEMVRCCKSNGKIGICDILAFENPEVEDYFEMFEKLVDISHHKTLSKQDFVKLFEENSLKIVRMSEVEIEHTISEYLGHAIQNEENDSRIDQLIDQAKTNETIGKFWTFGRSREDTKFRKKVILLLGQK